MFIAAGPPVGIAIGAAFVADPDALGGPAGITGGAALIAVGAGVIAVGAAVLAAGVAFVTGRRVLFGAGVIVVSGSFHRDRDSAHR